MKKRKLNIVTDDVTDSSCFSLHEKHRVNCERKFCNNWISYEEARNCAILASKEGPKTLQEIGKIYGLTRMRICQIEKNIYEKIKNVILER